MKLFLCIIFLNLLSHLCPAQSNQNIFSEGNYYYFKATGPPEMHDAGIDSLITLKDSLQIMKVNIGGDYTVTVNYERFFFDGKDWKYVNSLKHVSSVPPQKFSSIMQTIDTAENQHEVYLSIKDFGRTTDKRTFFYLVICNGKVIKSLHPPYVLRLFRIIF